MVRNPEETKAGRGRMALVSQFKAFYRDSWDDIRSSGATKDYLVLMAKFAEWVEVRFVQFTTLTEPQRNTLLSRVLARWEDWVEVVNTAAEELIFSGVIEPSLNTIPLKEGGLVKGDSKLDRAIEREDP